MKKRWMVLGIIVSLVIGYCQVVAQADVGGHFQAVVQVVVEAVVVDEEPFIAHILG